MLLAYVGQGRLARTIRRRVIDFRHIANFMLASWGHLFPPHIAAFLDYLRVLADGGSSRAKLERAVSSLGFVETAGGVSLADRLSKHSLVNGALAEYSSHSPHAVTRPVRRAPQAPFAIVA